jgi:hypothetical protein
MTSVLSCGSWNRTNIKTFRASRPTVRRSRNCCLVPGVGIEPTDSWFKARHHYQQRRPRNCVCNFKVPCGVEPASPAWKAGISAARPRAQKAEGEGVEPSRLIARLFSRQLPSPIGLPFRYQLRRQESNLRGTRLTDARLLPTAAPPQ